VWLLALVAKQRLVLSLCCKWVAQHHQTLLFLVELKDGIFVCLNVSVDLVFGFTVNLCLNVDL
jgi:hypothetical protein